MADDIPVPPNAQQANQVNYYQLLSAQNDVIAKRRLMRERHGIERQFEPIRGELQDVEVDASLSSSLLITNLNGSSALVDQIVRVEWLRQDQQLVIPAPLNMTMGIAQGSTAHTNPALRDLYWRVANMSYRQIVELVSAGGTNATRRTRIQEHEPRNPGTAEIFTGWNEEQWFELGTGEVHDDDSRVYTMAILSQTLRLNCDIRDVGALLQHGMRCSDTFWSAAEGYTRERLAGKLSAYTLQCTAALNLPAVNQLPLAAWTRAHGLSCGVLPTADSASSVEYYFTLSMPTRAQIEMVSRYEMAFDESLSIRTIGLNLIAMFGLLHLNKDHTYRPGDEALDRVGGSYLSAIRTIVSSTIKDHLADNREIYLRTTAHVFGLAQTYWLARALTASGTAAVALGIRIGTTPPTVQRLMVANAAVREWSTILAGVTMQTVYGNDILNVCDAVTAVCANPPSYSNLHRLYGIPEKKKVSDLAMQSANAMMPCIYGFAFTQHETESGVRDGLALALSLQNVSRDFRALTEQWKTIWANYFERFNTMELEDFAKKAIEMQDYLGTGTRQKPQLSAPAPQT